MLNDHFASMATKAIFRLVALIIVASTIVGNSLVTTISASSVDQDNEPYSASTGEERVDTAPAVNYSLCATKSDNDTLEYIPAVADTSPPAVTGATPSGTELIDHAANNTLGTIKAPSYPNSDVATPADDAVDTTDIAEDGFVYVPEIPLSESLQYHTYQRCLEKDLTYTIVLALMWRESRFDTNAVGYNSNGTRDHGVMQINDVNRGWLNRELGVNNLMDPVQNINAGTEMLGRMAEKHGMHNALMAYQYGEQGMLSKVRQGVTTNRLVDQLYAKSQEFDQLVSSNQQEMTLEVA